MVEKVSPSEKKHIILLSDNKHEEIMSLITSKDFRGFSPLGSQLFIERGNSKEIMAYVVSHPLPERGELALFKRGISSEIIAYVLLHQPHSDSEHYLIKRGVHPEIMALLENHKLFSGSVVALIQRSQPDEIEKAARKGIFDEEGELELIRFGVHRLIMIYIGCRELQPKAKEALYRRNHTDEISLYEKKYMR